LQAPPPRATPRLTDAVAATPLRVLVVDDNVDAAHAMAYVLKLGGHEVTIAHDGPGALAAATSKAPELVLLDIGLPGMDGYAVAGRMRAAGLHDVAIVAVTGYGREDDLRRSTEAGFDHHLVKPVDAAMVRRIIAEVVDRRRVRRLSIPVQS
jgi:CheY-like chemotaxis protein